MPVDATKKASQTPRTRKPDGMSLEQWQTALRREFGRQQRFKLVNVGQEPVFSDYNVTNPQTGRTYRVAIRGNRPGDNHCSCPDFAVNTLGTCKHIEFALSRLERRPGGKRALVVAGARRLDGPAVPQSPGAHRRSAWESQRVDSGPGRGAGRADRKPRMNTEKL